MLGKRSVDDANFLVPRSREGLDASRARNAVQGAVALVFAATGAVGGFLLVEDQRGLAALAGALVGFATGTFLAGFVLMIGLPPWQVPPVTVQSKLKEARFNYRFACVVGPTVVLLGLMAIPLSFRFGNLWSGGLVLLLCLQVPLFRRELRVLRSKVRMWEDSLDAAEVRNDEIAE